jgi:flagellar motor switch protein FliM
VTEQSQEEIDAMSMDRGVDRETVVDYDFSVPNPIPPEQRKTVKLIHETYSQALGLTLSSILRAETSVTLSKVDQEAFANYAKSLVNPTCIATFDMLPLNGYGIIEINAALMYSMINRMLGGDVQVPDIGRSFTALEVAIVRKIVGVMLSELGNAWHFLININFTLKETQTNPTFVRIIPAEELCLVITLKVKIGDTSGLVTLCVPYSNLEPIASKLDGQQWQRYKAKQSDEVQEAHRRNFGKINIDLTAVLGEIEIPATDLLALQTGDVLDLGSRTRQPIRLRVAGVNKFEVNPGLIGRHKGVVIHKEISKE